MTVRREKQSHFEDADLLAQNAESADETREVIRANARMLEDDLGGFAQESAMSSMTEAFFRDLKMSFVARPLQVYAEGRLAMEVDVFAHSKDPDGPAIVGQLERCLEEDSIKRMARSLRGFRRFFTGHAHRTLYGIIAAREFPDDDLREQVLREGIYLARIHDGQFELQVPEGFQPQAF
jgi:hypothetical protein